jgi:hypothetical protein
MRTRKGSKGKGTKRRNMKFYFYPSQKVQPQIFVKGLKPDEKQRVTDLTSLASSVRSTLEKSGLKNWEVTLEGYLEASTGVLPGGKVGFKAAIKFGSG